jgi:PAS domain S-box-containing protein
LPSKPNPDTPASSGPDRQRSIDLAAFAQFSELTPDALVAVDAAGRIVMVNSQVKPVFGYDRDELVGEPVERLVPPAFSESHGRHRTSYLADPRTRPMGQGRLDLRGRRKDGVEFPAEISLSSIETSIGPLAVAAIRDVSDRMHAEQQRAELEARLVREQALAQASRMESIGQLAGGIAHDFNNLLSVIIGNAGFLAGQLAPGTQEHEEVEEIRRASVQAAGLTRQLLLFSRREVIEPVALDTNRVVGDVERLLRRTLGEQVDLITRLTPDLPPVLVAPGGIEQILINLAVNARDAMPDGGSLTIETSEVEFNEEEAADRPGMSPGRHVRLSVVDTGTGMTPEILTRAMEPFFSTKSKGDGTGLGLATVYGIVRQAGGGVVLDSTSGRGTAICVDLPAAAGLPQSHRQTGAVPAGSGQHVLIVEDDDAVRRIAERILRRNGYRVTSVSSGARALEELAVDTLEIDVLLSDVVMPEMTGIDLVQQAREMRPGLVVVLMSGYIDPLADPGGDSAPPVVQKPFTEASLTSALRAALAT